MNSCGMLPICCRYADSERSARGWQQSAPSLRTRGGYGGYDIGQECGTQREDLPVTHPRMLARSAGGIVRTLREFQHRLDLDEQVLRPGLSFV